MIIADLGDEYQFVTQPAHAALAGRFADHWGSSSFHDPLNPAAARIAAYNHDNGWWSFDRQPHRADGELIDFRTPPPDTWIELYEAGIAEVVSLDRYAGLLVSMHGAGLRRRRYGLSPDWPAPGETFSPFVDREEDRQRRLAATLLDESTEPRLVSTDLDLLETLHDTGEPGAFSDSPLWFEYRLLQAWDVLSLAFCVTDSPPGYDPVELPTAPGDSAVSATLSQRSETAFEIAPYPFDRAPLDAWIPRRRVSKAALQGGDSPLEAYYLANKEYYRFTFHPPDG